MNRIFRVFIALLAMFTLLSNIHAQHAVLASGGDASGDGGTVAYSIGQVAYEKVKSGAGEVTQGVQQAYLSIMVSNEEPELLFQAGLYPNPVQSDLQLKFSTEKSFELDNFTYILYDLSGMELSNGKIENEVTNISVADKAEGVYFLELRHDTNLIQTFKVIKTQ